MKPFLKKFAQVGGIVALALVLGIGVSVFADNYVGAPAFPQNAPTPLNILGDATGAQSKGDASAIPGAGNYGTMPLGKQNFAGSTLSLWGSTFVGKNLNVLGAANTGDLTVGSTGVSTNSRVGNIFGKLFINNDTTSSSAGIKVGGDGTPGTLASTLRAALDIDLTGRTLNSSQEGVGADAVSVKSAVGAISSAFITNSQVFHFYSDLIAKDARIWAGSVKLSEYNPAGGKVLTSADSNGNAVWGTLGGGVPLSGNDVLVLGRYYDNDGSAKVQNAWAYCPSNYVAVSGGGDCEGGGIQISQPIHSDFGAPGAYAGGPGWSDQSSSNPGGYTYVPGTDKVANYGRFPNGWQLKCAQGRSLDLHINVVCLKITPPTVTYPAPTVVGLAGGGSSLRTWQYATLVNANASSCAAAFGATNAADLGVKIDGDYVNSVNAPSPSLFSFTRPASPNPTYGAQCMLMNDTTDVVTLVSSSTPKPAGSSWVGVGTSSIIKVDDLDNGVNIWSFNKKQSFLASLEKKVSDFLIPEAHAIPPGGTLPVSWAQQRGWAVVYR